jgi:hypothetical protein
MKDLLDVVGYNKNEKTSSDISKIENSKCDSFSTCPLSKTPQLSKGIDIRGVIMDSDNNVSFGESTIHMEEHNCSLHPSSELSSTSFKKYKSSSERRISIQPDIELLTNSSHNMLENSDNDCAEKQEESLSNKKSDIQPEVLEASSYTCNEVDITLTLNEVLRNVESLSDQLFLESLDNELLTESREMLLEQQNSSFMCQVVNEFLENACEEMERNAEEWHIDKNENLLAMIQCDQLHLRDFQSAIRKEKGDQCFVDTKGLLESIGSGAIDLSKREFGEWEAHVIKALGEVFTDIDAEVNDESESLKRHLKFADETQKSLTSMHQLSAKKALKRSISKRMVS